MDKQQNKRIAVAYKLFTVNNDGEELVEEATKKDPFVFISGFDLVLPKFEEKIASLPEGGTFDFTLEPEDAYGERDITKVITVNKLLFMNDGIFDELHVFEGAMLPMSNADGDELIAEVVSMEGDFVTLDLNHPLAGERLRYQGHVVDTHEATNKEIEEVLNDVQD